MSGLLFAAVAILYDAVADLLPCGVAKFSAPFVMYIIRDAVCPQMLAGLALIGDFLARVVALVLRYRHTIAHPAGVSTGDVAAESDVVQCVDYLFDVERCDCADTPFAGTGKPLHNPCVGAAVLPSSNHVQRRLAKLAQCKIAQAILNCVYLAVEINCVRILAKLGSQRMRFHAVKAEASYLPSIYNSTCMPGTMRAIVPRQVLRHLHQQVNPFLMRAHVIP